MPFSVVLRTTISSPTECSATPSTSNPQEMLAMVAGQKTRILFVFID
jgi:hypothetical protein